LAAFELAVSRLPGALGALGAVFYYAHISAFYLPSLKKEN
jgi:hypothetical protein